MTLFGRTLDGQAIASLVFMLMVLVLWIGAWRGERQWTRWFRSRGAGSQQAPLPNKSAEDGAERPAPEPPRGPWG